MEDITSAKKIRENVQENIEPSNFDLPPKLYGMEKAAELLKCVKFKQISAAIVVPTLLLFVVCLFEFEILKNLLTLDFLNLNYVGKSYNYLIAYPLLFGTFIYLHFILTSAIHSYMENRAEKHGLDSVPLEMCYFFVFLMCIARYIFSIIYQNCMLSDLILNEPSLNCLLPLISIKCALFWMLIPCTIYSVVHVIIIYRRSAENPFIASNSTTDYWICMYLIFVIILFRDTHIQLGFNILSRLVKSIQEQF